MPPINTFKGTYKEDRQLLRSKWISAEIDGCHFFCINVFRTNHYEKLPLYSESYPQDGSTFF